MKSAMDQVAEWARLGCRVGWWGACGWGRACQHRPASRALGDLESANDLHKQALDRREKALGREGRHTLASRNNLAETQRALGDLNGARERQEQTLDAYIRVLGEDHPETLTCMDNLAITRRALGDLEGARRLHELTVTGFRQMLGDDHPDTLRSMNNLGEVLWELGVR